MMKLDKVCSLVNSCVPRSAKNKKKPFTFVVQSLSVVWVTKVLGFLGLKGFPGCGTFSLQVGTVLGELGRIDFDKSCEPGFKSQLCCLRAVDLVENATPLLPHLLVIITRFGRMGLS